MEPLGFIHDMMDVKVLILYVAARLNAPVGLQDLYALAYQDDRLSYFDVCTAVPALVASGHLAQVGQGYEITEKGRTDCAATEDSLAYPVRQRAEKAVERFNLEAHRSKFIKTRLSTTAAGETAVQLRLDDEQGSLMRLELTAPNPAQAAKLRDAFQKKAERLYQRIMEELLENLGK